MRSTLLILISFIYFNTQAQQKKSVQYIGWKGNRVELHTIGNKQQSCSFIFSKDSIKAFLVTGSSDMFELYTIRRSINEEFLGGFFKNGHIYLFLNNGMKPGLHSWAFQLHDRSLTEHTIPFAIKDEKIVQRLSSNNYFFYFTVSKKSSEFVIYKFNDETQLDTLRYQISPALMLAIRRKSNQFFGTPPVNIEKTDMEGECDINLAQCPNKIYVRNDTLYLLINNNNALTSIVSFDLKTNQLDQRFIHHDQEGDYPLIQVYNSFLMRDKLYYAAASESNLLIQVVDFYSGKIEKEFKAAGEEEIAFKNTSITQEGGAFNNTRELGKTRQLLRKMANGNIVITATPDDLHNRVEILVGSYKEIKNNSGGGMWIAGGGMIGAGISMAFIPTGGFTRDSWTKSARFKMLLDAKTFEHFDGEIPPSINDRIKDYTRLIRIPGEGENLFVINGQYCYAYYDKELRELNLVQF